MSKTEELTPAGIWKPENEGDQIKGVVKGIEEGQYGLRALMEVPELDGEIWTPSHRVLQNRLTKAKVGDVLIITYEGEEPSTTKGHSPTQIYKVEREVKD